LIEVFLIYFHQIQTSIQLYNLLIWKTWLHSNIINRFKQSVERK
jgi:hypothetical protein